MRIESSVQVFKLTVNFRVVKAGFNLANYEKREEYKKLEEYKKNNNIVTKKEYPILLVEFSGSASRIKDLRLKVGIKINFTDNIDFEILAQELPKDSILFSLDGISKLSIRIKDVSYKRDDKEYREISTNAPIEYEKEYFDSFNDRSKLENYYFLTNYFHESFYYRGIFLKTAFKNLEEITTNGFFIFEGKKYIYTGDDLNRIKSLIQIEIVSMIMMYIEDLVILLESNRLNKNFYELLDIKNEEDTDVGGRIGIFFDSIEKFTPTEWRKILCYIECGNEYCTSTVDTVLKKNIRAMKLFLKNLRSFSKSHHRIFRRYKHAGFPIRYAGQMNLIKFFPLQAEFYTSIFVGNDSLNDLAMLPYSKDIIDSYQILITAIQVNLRDALIHRINCILKNVKGVIPLENLFDPYLAEKYEEEYTKDYQKFESDHPKKFFDVHVVSILNHVYLNEMTWYKDLMKNKKKWKRLSTRLKRYMEQKQDSALFR